MAKATFPPPKEQAPAPDWDSASIVRPVGAFVVKDGAVTWSPSVDVMRIVVGGQLVALAGILVLGRIFTHHRRRS